MSRDRQVEALAHRPRKDHVFAERSTPERSLWRMSQEYPRRGGQIDPVL